MTSGGTGRQQFKFSSCSRSNMPVGTMKTSNCHHTNKDRAGERTTGMTTGARDVWTMRLELLGMFFFLLSFPTFAIMKKKESHLWPKPPKSIRRLGPFLSVFLWFNIEHPRLTWQAGTRNDCLVGGWPWRWLGVGLWNVVLKCCSVNLEAQIILLRVLAWESAKKLQKVWCIAFERYWTLM